MFDFLPTVPLPKHPLTIFGSLLLAGFVGGEIVRRVFDLPRTTGYVLVGLALGHVGLKPHDAEFLGLTRLFVDIALGLILFELGRRIDFWSLRHDRRLLGASVSETLLSGVAMFSVLVIAGFKPSLAAVAAAIGMSTSPAIPLMVVQDTRASGPLTERTLALVALNSSIGFVVVTAFLPLLHFDFDAPWTTVVLHPAYLLGGSVVLGFCFAVLALWLARRLGKRVEHQHAMLIALILVGVGTAATLKLSVLITLLALGFFSRLLDRRHDIISVDMAGDARLFVVVLFVLAGATLQLSLLPEFGLIALLYIFARLLGKAVGALPFLVAGGEQPKRALLTALTLTPMSGTALASLRDMLTLYPTIDPKLNGLLLTVLLILQITSPAIVQFALRRAGEAPSGEASGGGGRPWSSLFRSR